MHSFALNQDLVRTIATIRIDDLLPGAHFSFFATISAGCIFRLRRLILLLDGRTRPVERLIVIVIIIHGAS